MDAAELERSDNKHKERQLVLGKQYAEQVKGAGEIVAIEPPRVHAQTLRKGVAKILLAQKDASEPSEEVDVLVLEVASEKRVVPKGVDVSCHGKCDKERDGKRKASSIECYILLERAFIDPCHQIPRWILE